MQPVFSTDHARERSLTDVAGVLVGHAQHDSGSTGCTVVRLPERSIGAVDIRGGGCATHETDALDPSGIARCADAFVLCGSSAPGLGCVSGAVDWHRSHGRGFPTPQGNIPIVPAAAIFDLSVGDPHALVTPEHARAACESASVDFDRGSVGAGAGASVGKVLGPDRAVKSGIGSAAWITDDGLELGALAVVNAFGDIVAGDRIVAGARDEHGNPLDTQDALCAPRTHDLGFGTNTTLVVVATNAAFGPSEMRALARMAHAGLPRAVRPCHTQYDGDLVFAASTQRLQADLVRAGNIAARLVECAVIDAVLRTERTETLPSARSLGWSSRDGTHA